jgi:hypothetical protein
LEAEVGPNSTHEQLENTMHINPADRAVERTWLTAGGAVGQLLASPETFKVLSAIEDDNTRGGVAALLLWAAGISPLPAETVSG